MEQYIQITKLNDFIFCPLSLYFHSLYENFYQKTYHSKSQTRGKIKHENIDKNKYSSAKRYMQGTAVYSSEYGLMGKIDIYDRETKSLIERKAKVKQIFDGYRYQLYAQMFCLKEMGYEVKKLFVHSLMDNKRYRIDLPNKEEVEKFENIIKDINNFDISKFDKSINKNKCDNCIYKELCNNK